ncbi:MAG: GLPGLI family protein [Flavobacteriaceae bacterium]|nr:GLPGLI family protein [Flavobacteriaceae bacterium]
MKNTLTLVATILFTCTLFSQNFQGKATYKSKRKLDIKVDSTQVNSEMHSQMMEMLKKQFEKTYVLAFSKEESIYKEEEKLGAPQRPSGMEMVMINTGGSDILYKNTKENRYTNKNDVFGKVFLIKDNLEKLDWKLGSKTKNIGEYTCYQATLKREVEDIESRISFNTNHEQDENTTPKMKEITITAWYTPEIPVSNGPGNYHGLPGLILEVNDGTETVICSKIVINSKDKSILKEPLKGKIVTQEKFETIMEKKMREMQDRYRGNSRDGGNIEMIIGG